MHVLHSLIWDEDAEPVGTGKLVHMAGPVGAVLQLISCIGTVFVPVAKEAQRHTTRVAWVPGRTGELVGAAGALAYKT